MYCARQVCLRALPALSLENSDETAVGKTAAPPVAALVGAVDADAGAAVVVGALGAGAAAVAGAAVARALGRLVLGRAFLLDRRSGKGSAGGSGKQRGNGERDDQAHDGILQAARDAPRTSWNLPQKRRSVKRLQGLIPRETTALFLFYGDARTNQSKRTAVPLGNPGGPR